jgi:hypothetical protein
MLRYPAACLPRPVPAGALRADRHDRGAALAEGANLPFRPEARLPGKSCQLGRNQPAHSENAWLGLILVKLQM